MARQLQPGRDAGRAPAGRRQIVGCERGPLSGSDSGGESVRRFDMIQFNNGSGSGSATPGTTQRWGDQLAGPADTQVVSREVYGGEQTEQQTRSDWTGTNVGGIERTVSVAAG